MTAWVDHFLFCSQLLSDVNDSIENTLLLGKDSNMHCSHNINITRWQCMFLTNDNYV